MDDSESYASPALFQVNARDTSQHIQVIQSSNNNLKRKGVDRPGDVGGKNYNYDEDEHSVSSALTSEDSDDDLYQSAKSDVEDDYMDVEDSPLHNDARDLVQSINGMYRVLDLISEQGSGGLGDFVV
ncbi:hypothetical protein AZE42_01562, partial [Rhizopogon vesiculosus]